MSFACIIYKNNTFIFMQFTFSCICVLPVSLKINKIVEKFQKRMKVYTNIFSSHLENIKLQRRDRRSTYHTHIWYNKMAQCPPPPLLHIFKEKPGFPLPHRYSVTRWFNTVFVECRREIFNFVFREIFWENFTKFTGILRKSTFYFREISLISK